MTTDAIVIVLDGGLISGIFTAEGKPLNRPVITIDYDAVSDFNNDDPSSLENEINSLYLVPQSHGGSMPALVQEWGQAGWLSPVVAMFISGLTGEANNV